MAAKAASYMKNIARSVGYSAIDVIKEANPAISAFAQNNSEVMKSAYHAISHMDSTISSVSSTVLDSKAGQLGKTAISNIKEDLHSGKWYNMERKRKADDAAVGSFFESDGDDDFDFDAMASGDFDFGGDDDVNLEDMVDLVGKKSSQAVSEAIVQTTEHSINIQTQLARASADQNRAMYANLHAAMDTINQNLGKMIEIANGPVTTHMENSKTFYETETKLSEERNSILREMLELQKGIYSKERRSSSTDKVTMGQIMDEHGMPDFEMYFDRIKQNLKSMSSGTGDLVKELATSGMLDSIIASPLEAITKGMVKTVIPNVLKRTMKEFNNTLSGAFSSAMAKIMNTETTNPVANLLKSVFGVKDSVKDNIYTNKYEKGAVPFDGIVRKSIIEVIPTHLARIESALTKSPERRYNYETGKFVGIDDITKSFDDIKNNAMKSAGFDIQQYMDRFVNAINFKGKEGREKSLKENFDIIMKQSFDKGEIFNHNDREKTAKSLGLKGKDAENDLILIRKMFESIPKNALMSYAKNVYEAKESINNEMRRREESGHDLTTALFNDSLGKNYYNNRPTARESKSTRSDRGKNGKAHGRSRSKKNKNKGANKSSSSSKEDDSSSSDDPNKIAFDEDNIESVAESAALAVLYMDEDDREGILTKIKNAEKTSDGVKKLINGIEKLINKPTDFLAGIIKKADSAVYNMIFGIEYDENSGQRKSVAAAIFDGLKQQFKDFNKWLKELLHPVRDYFNREGTIGNKVKNFAKSMAGKANSSEFATRFKDTFKNVKDSAVDAVKDGASKVKDAAENLASDKVQFDKVSDLVDTIKGAGSVDNAASGMRKVKKTGVIAVSEGEMIIPPDLNPYNIERRNKNENKAKQQFVNSLINKIPGFDDGGTVNVDENGTSKAEDAQPKKSISDIKKELKERIADKWISKIDRDPDSAIDELNSLEGTLKNRVIDALKSTKYKEVLSLLKDKQIKNMAKGARERLAPYAQTAKDSINRGLGRDDKEPEETPMTKKQQIMVTDAMGEIKKYAPEVAAGSVLGAGVSFVTGAIGGPLLGAAVGGGISLLKNSETVNKMLFGDLGEDGKRQGGLLSKELSQNFQKYAPSIGKGAAMGAITSILPFVPGGPVAGAILGSAIGFATQNEEIKNALFGEEGLLGKEFPEKVKKALPAMGVGAAAGLVMGPFGVVPNMVLGSAAGLATTTDTFKDIMFGKVGDDNKRHGGILETAVQSLFKPIGDFTKDTILDLTKWAEENIKQPLKDAIDPLKKQIGLMFEGIHKGINKLFEESLGATFDDMLRDYIFKPVTGFIKKITGMALAPIKMVVSAPFKLIGAIGNGLRNRQIKRGNADYMTADERLAFREQRGLLKNLNITKGAKRWKGYDEALSNMGADEAGDLADKISWALNSEQKMKDSNKDAFNTFTKRVRKNKNLSARDVNKIAEKIEVFVKEGRGDSQKISDKVSKYLDKLGNLSAADRSEIMDGVNEFLKSSKEYHSRRREFGQNKERILQVLNSVDAFKEQGLDIQEKDLPKLLKYLEVERKSKTLEGSEEDTSSDGVNSVGTLDEHQKERHAQIIDKLQKINETLESLKNPDRSRGETLGRVDDISDREAFNEYMRNFFPNVFHDGRRGLRSARHLAADAIRGGARYGGMAGGALARGGAWAADHAYNNGVMGYHGYGGDHYWRNNVNNKEDNNERRTLVAASEGEVIAPSDITDAIPNYAGGGEVDDNNTSKEHPSLFDNLRNWYANKKNKDENVRYEFNNGRQFKYRKDDNGEWIMDKSDSETVESLKAINEEENQKKNFFKSLTDMPKSLLGSIKAAFNGDDDDKGNKKGILGKIFNVFGGGKNFASGLIGKGIAAVIGIPILTGLLKKFFGETELGQTIATKFQEVTSSLNIGEKLTSVKDGIVGWLAGEEGAIGGGLPGLIGAAAEHWATGFEFICANVIPKALEIVVQTLPSMLMGVARGIGKIISTNFYNILHGGQKAADLVQKDADYDSEGGIISINGIESVNGSHSFEFNGKKYNKSNWSDITGSYKGGSITTNFSSLNSSLINGSNIEKVNPTTGTGQNTGEDNLVLDANASYGTKLEKGLVDDYKDTEAYKSLGDTAKDKLDSQIEDMQANGQNVFKVNMGTEAEPNWQYKTLQEILANGDQTLVTVTGKDGSPKEITGQDILNNPTLGQDMFGLNWQLTDEERQQNKEDKGLAKDSSFLKTMLTAGAKRFFRADGSNGTTPLSLLAKGASKVPFLGWPIAAAAKATDLVTKGAGKLGEKTNDFLANKLAERSAQKGAAKAAEKATEKAAGKGIEKAVEGGAKVLADGSIVYDNIDDVVDNMIDGAADKAATGTTVAGKATANKGASKAIQEGAEQAIQEGGEKALNSAAKEAAESSSKGIVGKIISWVTKHIGGLRNNSTIYKFFKNGLTKAGKEANKKAVQAAVNKVIESIEKKALPKFVESVAKAGTKVLGKIAGAIASAGTITLISSGVAFVKGFNNAENTLGVIQDNSLVDYDPSFGVKLICGLVAFINELFFYGIIPTDLIFNIAYEPAKELFNIPEEDTAALDKARAESDEVLADINREQETNMSVDEYNASQKWTAKAKKEISDFFLGKEDENGERQGGVAGGLKDIGNGITNLVSDAKNGIVDFGKGVASHAKNAFDNATGNFFNDDAIRAKYGVGEDYQVTMQDRVSSFIGENIGRFFGKDFTKEVNGTIDFLKQSALDGLKGIDNKLGSIFGMVDENGNPLSLTDGAKQNIDAMKKAAVEKWNDIKENAGEFVDNIKESATEKFESFKEGVAGALENANKNLGSMLGVVDDDGNPLSLTEGIVYNFDKFREAGAERWNNEVQKAKDFFGDLKDKTKEKFKSFKDSIGKALDNLNKNIGAILGMTDDNGNVLSLTEGAKYKFDKFRKGFTDGWKDFQAGAKSMWESAKDWFSDRAKESQSKVEAASGSGAFGAFKDSSASGTLSSMHARGSATGKPHSDSKYADNSAFVSQLDSRYANKSFNISGDSEKQTIADTGCGPAAAAMVVNDAYQNQDVLDMKHASKDALSYKVKDGGVNAAYFEKEFTKHGLMTKYIMDGNQESKNQDIINNLRSGNRTILMGSDPTNRSKVNSPYGPNDHYIVATRISDDGKYVWVNDPESKTPEIKYPTGTILNNTRMGVAGIAASGSRLLNTLHAKGSSITTRMTNRLKLLNGRGSYGSDTPQYKVWVGLKNGGYNDIACAAAMGNIEHESGFNPDLIEKGSGVGFGLIQWSYGRRTAYENYARSKGKSAGDLGTQIEYLLKELDAGSGIWTKASSNYGFGSLSRDDWANGKDVETATKAFMCCFERPSYSSSINHIDRRITSAKQYLEAFAGVSGDGSSSSSANGESSSDSSSSSGTILDKIFGVFDDFAVAYGLKSKSSSSSDSSGDSNGSSGGTTGGSDKQNALVDKMKSVEGQLAYSQQNRNPDTGSGDCSSTVQWAYQKVLGIDPGSWTGAQETDEDLYTVANNVNDTSKLQPGDLILFRKGGRSSHVEMYAGNGQMIGHGGGSDGKKKGPTIKAVAQNYGSQSVAMVRRWTGFKDGASASGSGLLDNLHARGTGYDPEKEIAFSDTAKTPVSRYRDNAGFLKKTRYDKDRSLKRDVKVPAGMYAAGSDIEVRSTQAKAPGRVAVKQPQQVEAKVNITDSSSLNDKVTAYLGAILKLLSKEVENTSLLSTIVAILTELVKISEEERSLNGKSGSSVEQKKTELENKRVSMLNILKATGIQGGGTSNELTKLVQDAERLARL